MSYAPSEPCRPYDIRPGQPDPVNLWEIIDRLTPDQLRLMAVSLSVWAPAAFERRLMETGRCPDADTVLMDTAP